MRQGNVRSERSYVKIGWRMALGEIEYETEFLLKENGSARSDREFGDLGIIKMVCLFGRNVDVSKCHTG